MQPQACRASPNCISTQLPSGMCPQLSPTSTPTMGHSWHLCWRKGELCIPSGAECKEPLGPLKPPWGLTLPSRVQLMAAASFHPAVSQEQVTSACGGQCDSVSPCRRQAGASVCPESSWHGRDRCPSRGMLVLHRAAPLPSFGILCLWSFLMPIKNHLSPSPRRLTSLHVQYFCLFCSSCP